MGKAGTAGGGRWAGVAVFVAALVIAPALEAEAIAKRDEAARQTQESIVLRPAFQAGQSIRYDLGSELEVTGSVEGSDAEQRERLEQTARVRLTTTEVDRAGVATVRLAFEGLRAEQTVEGGDGELEARSFAWPEEDAAGEAADSPFAKMYRALAEKGLELQVLPDGTVRAVSGMDEVYAAGEGLDEPARSRALGVLAPGAIAENLSAIWRIDPGERRTARRPGDSWTVAKRTPVGPLGTAALAVRYTLGRVTDGVAEISGEPAVSLEAGEGLPDPAQPAATLTSQEGEERVRWDVEAGRLVERERRGRVAWEVRLATSEPIAAEATSSERVWINLVEGEEGMAEEPAEPAAPPEP